MNAGDMLKVMNLAENSIWKEFGLKESLNEYIDDLTECKWNTPDNQDIGVIINNEEYSFEVYGTSVWKNDEFTIAKIYDGSGGMYCIMMSNKYRMNLDDFDNLLENLEEK